MNKQSFSAFKREFYQTMAKTFGSENILPFWGNPTAKIVHIGQAPSKLGVKNQKPFTDKTGQKLREVWYQVDETTFYNPDNFYFTALGMYFPGKSKHGGDKPPSLPFAKVWLNRELSYLHPQLYIILGGLAAKFFFAKQKFEDLVMKDQVLNSTPTLILPHASPLNIKWFKNHPQFITTRLSQVRDKIHSTLLL